MTEQAPIACQGYPGRRIALTTTTKV